MEKEIDKDKLVEDYKSGKGLYYLTKTYHIGKLKAKAILSEYGVEIKHRGKQDMDKTNFIVKDWKIEKYPKEEGYEYIAVSKSGDFKSKDYMNNGGVLTTYIKKLGYDIPTLYDRRIYYMQTGNYWWEQWFNIEKAVKKETKKCPYCDWETIDIDNKSGMFMQHITHAHNITPEEYLSSHPEDKHFFINYNRNVKRSIVLKDKNNYVVCPICGEKFCKITETHLLSKHNLTIQDFEEKYPSFSTLSKNELKKIKEIQKTANLTVSKKRFISSYEMELRKLLDENNIKYEANRQILEGKEIDILIPDMKIGIEFNGLKWHTEWFGKKEHNYHLNKTITCNKHGYKLIHIFEDEYVYNKELIQQKILYLLGKCENKPHIYARKCEIKEILKKDSENFLNKNHIQGFTSSSVYYGAFYKDKLIAVMTFKKNGNESGTWELNRFATDNNNVCVGIGSKLLKHFINEYTPRKIISFADRRWTLDKNDNLYIKLGFKLDKILKPDYRYYNNKIDKYKRFHKSLLRKNTLHKKYGLPLSMTEKEMAKELGYDRIWDCGLFRYVWEKE